MTSQTGLFISLLWIVVKIDKFIVSQTFKVNYFGLKSELFMVERTFKTKGIEMTQIHRRFTAEQVKVLFQGYCQGNLSRSDVEDMLGIGKTLYGANIPSDLA
jgi:hypothetical protein